MDSIVHGVAKRWTRRLSLFRESCLPTPRVPPPSLSPREHRPLCPGGYAHPASCPAPFIQPRSDHGWPGETTLQGKHPGEETDLLHPSKGGPSLGCPPHTLSQELGTRQRMRVKVRVGGSKVGSALGRGFPHADSCSSRTILLSVISLLNEPNTFSPANVDASVMYRKWKESKGKDREYTDIIR